MNKIVMGKYKKTKEYCLMIALLILRCAEFVNAQVKLIKMHEGRRKYLVYLPNTYQESPSKNLQRLELLTLSGDIYSAELKE